jgi:hypothetical protein
MHGLLIEAYQIARYASLGQRYRNRGSDLSHSRSLPPHAARISSGSRYPAARPTISPSRRRLWGPWPSHGTDPPLGAHASAPRWIPLCVPRRRLARKAEARQALVPEDRLLGSSRPMMRGSIGRRALRRARRMRDPRSPGLARRSGREGWDGLMQRELPMSRLRPTPDSGRRGRETRAAATCSICSLVIPSEGFSAAGVVEGGGILSCSSAIITFVGAYLVHTVQYSGRGRDLRCGVPRDEPREARFLSVCAPQN